MSNTISSDDDIIDSRDVIRRIDELEGEHDSLVEDVDTARAAYEGREDIEDKEPGATPEWDDLVSAESALSDWENSLDAEELNALKLLASEADCASDWIHGAQFINEDYFEKYIMELINDCYSVPKEMASGEWPWRHLEMDWSGAADEVKADYTTVEFNGTDFYVRA